MQENDKTINDVAPNFRGKDGRLYLVRCFSCSSTVGRENYCLCVSGGVCAWCGWKDGKTQEIDNEPKNICIH